MSGWLFRFERVILHPMELNSIVIVSLGSPKEKIWGQLLQLDAQGVTVRGIELNSFDDFVRQIVGREECTVGMTQVFYPMHRVERVALDESSGSIPSLSERFQTLVGLSIQEYLGIEMPQV
jgi:deoxyribodipyrimidine photolyase-like uncharacterized protein